MHGRRALVVVACCASVAACGDDPPTQPTPNVQLVELTGPSTIAPGSVGVFTLTAFYSNGTQRDVTEIASWCCDQSTLQRQGPGRFLGRASGDAFVSANIQNLRRTKQIIVLPAGTYRVTGRVFEPGTTAPVPQARVSVSDGAGGSVAADTDFSGNFRLYGVPPNAEFVISRAGYQTQSQQMTFTDHAAVNFELPLDGPRLEFSGTYTATFDWRGCTSGIRPEESHRVYTAAVAQAGSVLDVRFTDAFFVVNSVMRGNMMQGQINAAGVTLFADRGFSYSYYYGPNTYPFLVERLADEGRLVVYGTATLAPSGASFVGEIKGFLETYGRSFPRGVQIGNCRDASVSFTDRR